MAQEIEVLLTKQFDEVQIDQFAIDWLVRQTAEFGSQDALLSGCFKHRFRLA